MKIRFKALTSRIAIDFLMYFILLVCLFPIFWMIITSLKSNYDILLGKVGFSRFQNSIIAIFPQNNKNIIFVSKDGLIGEYTSKENKFKVLKDLRKKAVSVVNEPNNLTLATNTEIITINKTNNRIKKVFSIDGIPWKLKNQVLSTSLVKIGNKYYLGKVMAKTDDDKEINYENQDKYEGLMVFDQNFKYLKTINNLNLILDQNIKNLYGEKNVLYVLTNKGLSLIDISKEQLIKTITKEKYSDFKDLNSLVKIGPNLLISGNNRLFKVNLNTFQVTALLPKINDINVILLLGKQLFLGSDNGFYGCQITDKNLENNLKCYFNDQAKYWNVTSLIFYNNKFWIGLGNGQIKIVANNFKEINSHTIRKGALDIRWENYIEMWQNIDFGTYLINSFVICFVTVIVALLMATTAGYALSRFRFPGDSIFSSSILAVNMIPPILILIPIYLMYIKFNDITGIPLVGTYPGIIALYATWFIPMSIWILRSFFAAIPVEIEEAARIDGCNRFQVFWRIALPLAMPGIIATGIYIFLIAWDELLFATILLPEKEMFTIPLGIKLYLGNHQNRFDLMMAAATVATLPVIIMFFIVQRWFIKGLTAGAVKG